MVGAVSAWGCGGSSEWMRGPVKSTPPLGTSGYATIVFLRPSTYAFTDNFRIVDHAGRFVGDALAGSYFVVRPLPGEYVFILDERDVDVLYANVAPGFVYYVVVAPEPGSFTPRAHFEPVRPTDRKWNLLGRDLSDPEAVPLFEKGQAALERDPGLRARIDRAKRIWASLSPADRAARSLGPSDGAAPAPPGYSMSP
jgi:hypothetical protein